jgi:single-strand DNA-binding protein
VAWSEKYKETETKLFLNCTAWRGTGEMVSKYFTKGKEIIVEGKLNTREWTDKEGNKRSTNEMVVDRVHFCGPKAGNVAGSPVNASAGDFTEELDDGELPF